MSRSSAGTRLHITISCAFNTLIAGTLADRGGR